MTLDSKKILIDLQQELKALLPTGCGPFLASICDSQGNLVSKEANSVLNSCCSHNHAEMNAISAAERKLGTHDLSAYDLHLFTTSEPCLMCLGGIMWSGIRHVHYGVTSARVEEITGFDEGYKPDWQSQFESRGISVEGPVAQEAGEEVLKAYVAMGHKVYNPGRNENRAK